MSDTIAGFLISTAVYVAWELFTRKPRTTYVNPWRLIVFHAGDFGRDAHIELHHHDGHVIRRVVERGCWIEVEPGGDKTAAQQTEFNDVEDRT
jgi:hypothetical protein